MSSVQISGNASGSGVLTVSVPNTNSNYTLTLPLANATLVGDTATQTLTNKTLTSPTLTSPSIGGTPVMSASVITSGTAQTSPPATPQYFDFTGIPSWVKRVTVIFNYVSVSGTSSVLIQLGTVSGIEISGYICTYTAIVNGNTSSGGTTTGGHLVNGSVSGGTAAIGQVVFTLLGSNTWVSSSVIAIDGSVRTYTSGTTKTLSGTLDRLRVTTTGSDTFDAGSINILYE